MKKVLIFLFMCFALGISAQHAFVRQNGTAYVYYRVDSVFTMAQNYDTIYLPGGSFSIGTLFIDKRLTIIGVGHYPDSTLATNATTLNGSITFTSAASFSSLTGVYLTGNINFGTNPGNNTVTNISITRCNFNSIIMNYDYWTAGSSSFISLKENMVRSEIRGLNAQFVDVEKNIIQGHVSEFNGNLLVKNNDFIGGSGCPAQGIINVSNSTFENNIFMHSSGCGVATISVANSCIFTNNVFNISYTFPYGSNIGSGNYVNISATGFFVNETNFIMEYTDNFHLTSPGTYLGTDGTQVGIYGTAQPYKEGAVPFNPHIRFRNIATQTNANGDLNVIITVGAQQQ